MSIISMLEQKKHKKTKNQSMDAEKRKYIYIVYDNSNIWLTII